MRKGRDGDKKRGKTGGGKIKRKIRMKIVATTSLPAVDRPNADCWNTARSRQKKIMTFIMATNVVASRPPERRPTGTPHARANRNGSACPESFSVVEYHSHIFKSIV